MSKTLYRFALPIAFCSLFCLPAAAAQPQNKTASPPSAKAPAPGPYDDPILQQRVTLNLKDANINLAVEALSKVAHVSLIVERPSSLHLNPVTLALNDTRLRDVMDMLGQLYGYRWRRRGDVFLLTIVPQKVDMDKFGEEAMKTLYDDVLTPEQRAKVDADGYIDTKDMTPGQQGIVAGYLQDMLLQSMSMQLDHGRVTIDRANKKLSISFNSGDDKK